MLMLPRRKLLLGAAASLLAGSALVGPVQADFSGGAISRGYAVVPPPAAANWSSHLGWGGSTTLTDVTGGILLQDPGAGSDTWRGAFLTAPSAPYTIDAVVIASCGQFGGVSVGWSDGTKGHLNTANTQGVGYVSQVTKITSFNSATVTGDSVPFYMIMGSKFYLRIADDGTNVKFSYSPDEGVNWILIFSIAKSSGSLGSSGYTKVGITLNTHFTNSPPSGSLASLILTSWLVH